MGMKSKFILSHQQARDNATQAVKTAPDGYSVVIEPVKRNLEQNAKFHAICHELSGKTLFDGKTRTTEDWKVLLVSAHNRAEGQVFETVCGLEGEVVVLRESTASMTKDRMISLIEYASAYLASQ